MKIIIRGDAQVRSSADDSYETLSAFDPALRMLDRLECQDNFMEFFQLWGKRELEEALQNVLGKYAFMHFEYNENTGKLETVTTYESPRTLSEIEENALIDYTCGQWSDGIGEIFEQVPACQDETAEYFISPWHREQVVTLTYES